MVLPIMISLIPIEVELTCESEPENCASEWLLKTD
jgi:hypothetical protein